MKNKFALLFTSISAMVLPLLVGCNSNNAAAPDVPDVPTKPEREKICNFNDPLKPFTIVVPENRGDAINKAANEIREYFYQVSGNNIEIIEDKDLSLNTNSRYISLGNTKIYEIANERHGEQALNPEVLNVDGFYMFTYGENLFINADIDRGVLYGAYQFIEDTFNVKFLSYDFTYVPASLDNIYLCKYDDMFVPEFNQRCYLNTAVWECKSDYVSHIRFNTDFAQLSDEFGGYTKWCDYGGGPSGTTHSLQLILPATDSRFCDQTEVDERYPNFKRILPEYHEVWSHQDGYPNTNQRVDTVGNADLCFTNGVFYNTNADGSPKDNSAVKLVAESLKKFILANPDTDNYMLGQADTPSGCPCGNCVRTCRGFNDKRSALTICFANKVSDLINEWIVNEHITDTNGNLRKINFCIFAYTYNEEPPLDNSGNLVNPICKPRDNVFVKYAPIYSIYYYGLDDPRNTSNTYGVAEKWSKVADTMLSWTYHCYFSDYFWYLDTTHGLKGTLQTLKDCGVIYAMGQGTYTDKAAYQQYLEAYVYSKLCWDLSANVDDVVNEFLFYYFGEDAYPYMRLFYDKLTLQYETIALQDPSLIRAISTASQFIYWPLNLLNEFVGYFDTAYTKTLLNPNLSSEMKNVLSRNILRGSLMPKYMRVINAKQYASLSANDVTEMAYDWVNLASKYGVIYIGEAISISVFKKNFNVG